MQNGNRSERRFFFGPGGLARALAGSLFPWLMQQVSCVFLHTNRTQVDEAVSCRSCGIGQRKGRRPT